MTMQRLSQRSSPVRVGLLVGLSVFVVVGLLGALGRLQSTENALLSLRFEVRGPRQVGDQVVLVTLEEGSVQAADGAAPWSREGLAELVRRLDNAGAAVIGLDLPGLAGNVIPARSPAEDELLARAMRQHGRVVLPIVIREAGEEQRAPGPAVRRFALGEGSVPRPRRLEPGYLAAPAAALTDAAAGLGVTNIYPDLDGAAREAPLAASWGGLVYPAFWVELLRVHEGVPAGEATVRGRRVSVGDTTFRADAELELLINYVGGYREFPRLPYRSVVTQSMAALRTQVAGKIVVVGTDLAGVTTLLRTPTAPLMPGVEVAATVTENLVAHTMLRRVPGLTGVLLTLILALLVGSLAGRSGPLAGLGITLALLAVVAAGGFGIFLWGVYVPLAAPLIAAALTGGVLVVNSASLSERRRAEAEARLQSRLQAIAGIGRLVNSSLDQNQLLVEILRWAESEIDAEGSSLLLMEPDGEHLRFEVALGERADMLKDITLRVGEGIAGTVASTCEPIIAQDVQTDARWSPDVAYAIDHDTRSILCVPMMLRDRVVGVMEVINKRDGSFTEHDVQLMQVIGAQSALFLENARLYSALSDKVDVANEELRRANDRLEYEVARITTLVDEMADGVIATDEADRIVIFNNAAERMFGVPEERAMGRQAVTVFDHPGLTDLFSMPLSPHGGSYETEIVLDEAEGQVVRAHIALIDQPGQRAVGKCAVFTDISHLKELDRMKMDLISFVSHELKNPIASLQGSCDMLHDRIDLSDERTARLLDIASHQSRRMQYLVQDFLDLSRIEAGQALELNWSEITDPEALVRGAMALCRGVGPEHHLDVEVAGGTPGFWADRDKLEAVLINLIENAVKYSPDGGDVTVRVRPEDGGIVIEVADQGVGIRPEDLPRLFRSFQRIHDTSYGRVSGTGVGLYICRHIMEAHGGTIDVESTWGEGSTFRLHLPLRTQSPEPAGPPGREVR